MKLTTPLLSASFLILLVAAATAYPEDKDEPPILCEQDDDCMGKDTVCLYPTCNCPDHFVMVAGDCFDEDTFDGELFRRKRSPGIKVEKHEKKQAAVHIKEAKKYDHRAAVPLVHGPISHSHVTHHASPVSRHRRAPSIEMIKQQARKGTTKETNVLTSRRRRDSHQKKNEKIKRNIAKEQVKKDSKKGHFYSSPAGHASHQVSYNPQPHHPVHKTVQYHTQHPVQHNAQHPVHKTVQNLDQHLIHKTVQHHDQHPLHKTVQHHDQHPIHKTVQHHDQHPVHKTVQHHDQVPAQHHVQHHVQHPVQHHEHNSHHKIKSFLD